MLEAVFPTQTHLLVWVDIDMAFDALLPHVSPAVSAHPLPFALGTFVLPKAPLLTLVGCQALSFWTCLYSKESLI